MKLNEGKPRENAPEGTHNARLVSIIDLGTQEIKDFKDPNKINKIKKINLAWELIEEQKEDGSPFLVGKEFTNSTSSKSNLGKILKQWLGIKEFSSFDVETALNREALITIVHEENESSGQTYAKISNVAGIPKGLKVGKALTPRVIFDLDAYDKEVFDALPEYLRLKIADSPEYAIATQPKGKAAAGKAKAGKGK